MVRKTARAFKIRLVGSRLTCTIAFMGNRTRLPIAAGAFYPGRRDELAAALATLFGDDVERSCSSLSAPCGLVVPHAGYPYSGATAAAGYRALAARGRPDVAIVLGANHTGSGDVVSLDDHETWRTPLGDTPVDHTAISELSKAGITIDPGAFAREHSIEVQLPFLQSLWGPDLPIVPICVQTAPHAFLSKAASALHAIVANRPATLLVASSDFTHYEPDESARRRDRAAIDEILRFDVDAFFGLCRRERLSICGAGAIAILMDVAQALGLTDAALVDYSTSGDTTGDRSAVVGYASISFFRRDHGS
jgi:AmmeMemoRadiSam system protein B